MVGAFGKQVRSKEVMWFLVRNTLEEKTYNGPCASLCFFSVRNQLCINIFIKTKSL